MGFRNGSFAKVWEIKPVSDKKTDLRISISYKDKQTGEYIDDFSGFVSCCGSVPASKAARLKVGDRIKLGDVDVSRVYNKEKQTNFETFKVFSFDTLTDTSSSSPTSQSSAIETGVEGDVEPDDRLPF